MADSKVPTSVPEVDAKVPGEKQWQYMKRMEQHHVNKGSRYPPFSIEHLPHERSRLATPMTAEDRFLRKQWLRDQILSPNEPRHVPEAIPTNSFRKLYKRPWDKFQIALGKVIGKQAAGHVRSVVPKFLGAYLVLLWGYYTVRYHPHDWQRHNGVFLYGARRTRFHDEDPSLYPEDPKQFALFGFDKRTVLRD